MCRIERIDRLPLSLLVTYGRFHRRALLQFDATLAMSMGRITCIDWLGKCPGLIARD